MLDTALLFITADDVDLAFLDRLALTLPGWSLGVELTIDDFADWVVSKDDYPSCVFGDRKFVAPVASEVPNNKWAGSSLDEVIAYFTQQAAREERDFRQSTPFLVVDQRGKDDETCVVVRLMTEHEHKMNDKYFSGTVSHWKMRMPWDQVYTLWCNIWVGNSDVDSFAQGRAPDEQGWFEYVTVDLKEPLLRLQKAGFAERDRRIKEVEEKRSKVHRGSA